MLHYKEDGSGPVLVFLHGFCEDMRIWNDYLPFFYSRYRVISIDLPGFGQSVAREPDLKLWAGECLKTLDSLSVDRFSLIGHSMGGYVALAIAGKAPERLESLCLFHSSAYADTEEKKQNRLKQVRFIEEYGVAKFTRQLVPGLFKEGYTGPGLSQALHIAESQSKEGLSSALLAMKDRMDTTTVLEKAVFPVLLLSGESDTLLPLKDQAALAALAPICQFSLLPQSGHMGMLEEPDLAQARMQHFFTTFLQD